MVRLLLILALVVAVLALIGIVMGYNKIRAADVRVDEALSGIDVELPRRAALIPSLVHTVQTFAAHEKGILDHVMEKAGGNRNHVQLHVGEEVGNGERVDQVRLTRMAHLSPVFEGREYVGPAQQLDVGIRAVCPDLFDQILEANHEFRCLTIILTCVFLLHYTGPVSAAAILLT